MHGCADAGSPTVLKNKVLGFVPQHQPTCYLLYSFAFSALKHKIKKQMKYWRDGIKKGTPSNIILFMF